MKIMSGLITTASGSLGGLTASRNRGGLYLRSRATPVNPNSAAQQTVRSALASLNQRWTTTLTEAQREGWRTYGDNTQVIDALGNSQFLTGQQMYLRGNVGRILAGLPVADDAPTVFNLGSFTPISATVAAGSTADPNVTFADADAWANEDGAAMLIFASRQQNPSVSFFRGPFRFIGSIEGDGTTPPASPAAVNGVFAADAGNVVYVKAVVYRADGRRSNEQIFRSTVA